MNQALARNPGPDCLGLGGLELVLDLSGALWLPGERTLLVADLHLEKGSSFARRGMLLPPYDSRATLAALALAIGRYAPRRIIALGDSFHERSAEERLGDAERQTLAALQAGRDWLWITGNHDPDPLRGVPGETACEIELGGVMLRHEPQADWRGAEIAGHLHPVAKVRGRGRAVRRRCFALSGTRCIMPAMGAYAGGLNLRRPAFAALFPAGFMPRILGDGRLFSVDERLLLPD